VEVLHRTMGAGSQCRAVARRSREKPLDAGILGPLHPRRNTP
jgi:hypothetical protein